MSKICVGVAIPCIGKHVDNLKRIIFNYTISVPKAPDHIAILMSGDLTNRQKQTWESVAGKNVIKIRVGDLVNAGPARQRLAYELKNKGCDLIAYQDADDLPHPMRIKFIHEWFKHKPETMVLNHSYAYEYWPKNMLLGLKMPLEQDSEKLYSEYFKDGFESCAEHKAFGDILDFPVHAGVPVIRPSVLNNIEWLPANRLPDYCPKPRSHTEDWFFCMQSLFRYKENHAIVNSPVYLYNPNHVKNKGHDVYYE